MVAVLPNTNLWPKFPDQIWPFDVCSFPLPHMLRVLIEGKQKALHFSAQGCLYAVFRSWSGHLSFFFLYLPHSLRSLDCILQWVWHDGGSSTTGRVTIKNGREGGPVLSAAKPVGNTLAPHPVCKALLQTPVYLLHMLCLSLSPGIPHQTMEDVQMAAKYTPNLSTSIWQWQLLTYWSRTGREQSIEDRKVSQTGGKADWN